MSDNPLEQLNPQAQYWLKHEHGRWQIYELGRYQRITALASACPIATFHHPTPDE